jgi:hypothetical protein
VTSKKDPCTECHHPWGWHSADGCRVKPCTCKQPDPVLPRRRDHKALASKLLATLQLVRLYLDREDQPTAAEAHSVSDAVDAAIALAKEDA